MLTATLELLQVARESHYAIGAFNVYNLEGVKAVISAAEKERSPVMLQIHPSALAYGGSPLIEMCLAAAREATIPAAVHLDHSTSPEAIRQALVAGVSSIMADGSHLDYGENIVFTREMTDLAHAHRAPVEAELGRITGTEDGLTVAEFEARMTDPDQALEFVSQTGIDALAVCIGNVHGPYTGEPQLDFDRLARIRDRVDIPLVLHGTSGLPEAMIRRAIDLGVCKFNVNTEVREAYLSAIITCCMAAEQSDLLDMMRCAVAAMQDVVVEKLRLFGSSARV